MRYMNTWVLTYACQPILELYFFRYSTEEERLAFRHVLFSGLIEAVESSIERMNLVTIAYANDDTLKVLTKIMFFVQN